SAALQDQLQRAADTAGKDETVAAALEALDSFQSEQVGVDRANARGPLRKAKDNLERVQGKLQLARGLHEDYLRLIQAAEQKAADRITLEGQRRAAKQ